MFQIQEKVVHRRAMLGRGNEIRVGTVVALQANGVITVDFPSEGIVSVVRMEELEPYKEHVHGFDPGKPAVSVTPANRPIGNWMTARS